MHKTFINHKALKSNNPTFQEAIQKIVILGKIMTRIKES